MRNATISVLALSLAMAVGCSERAAEPAATESSAAAAKVVSADGMESNSDSDGSFDLNAATMEWREGRLERLQKPDGWLSLVGLHWLEPGDHTLGSADDNDIQLTTGPAHIGRIALVDGVVTLSPSADAAITINDEKTLAATVLGADTSETPSIVSFDGQQAGFTLIERSGRLGLRVKDAEATTRTGFVGIDYFDVDPQWRFDARFEAHPPGQTIKIASVINTLDDMVNPGRVIFEKDGTEYSLEAVDEGDGQLFLIFADRTSGKSTYGPGRSLYAAPAVDGHTVVDFNQAYNPPCAFNAYSTCPLPPPENRLDMAITAGEKKYAGSTH